MELPNEKSDNRSGKHHLVDIIEVFTEWRKFILISVFISISASTLVAFLITPKFKATASVLPAEQTD